MVESSPEKSDRATSHRIVFYKLISGRTGRDNQYSNCFPHVTLDSSKKIWSNFRHWRFTIWQHLNTIKHNTSSHKRILPDNYKCRQILLNINILKYYISIFHGRAILFAKSWRTFLQQKLEPQCKEIRDNTEIIGIKTMPAWYTLLRHKHCSHGMSS